MSVVLGVAMVAEALLLPVVRLVALRAGDATTTRSHTFSFLTLLYFAVFSIVSARERRCVLGDAAQQDARWPPSPPTLLVGTALTFVGLPGLTPLPWWQTLAIFGYAMVACLGVNDAVKVAMIRWRVPAAASEG